MTEPLDILGSRDGKQFDGWSYKLAGTQFGLDAYFPGALDIDEKRMCAWIPYADGNRRDGVGDVLRVQGIRLERHKANPVHLFDHGKQVTLPIGLVEDPETGAYTGELDLANNTAKDLVYYYQGKGMPGVDSAKEYEHAVFCQQVFHMLVKRLLRGGSIGYQVIAARELGPDYNLGTPKGLDLLSVLKLESSTVVMPANADTVRKSFKDEDDYGLWLEGMRGVLSKGGKCCGKDLSPMLAKSLVLTVPEETKTMSGYEEKAAGRFEAVVIRTHRGGGETKKKFSSLQEAIEWATDEMRFGFSGPAWVWEGATRVWEKTKQELGLGKGVGFSAPQTEHEGELPVDAHEKAQKALNVRFFPDRTQARQFADDLNRRNCKVERFVQTGQGWAVYWDTSCGVSEIVEYENPSERGRASGPIIHRMGKQIKTKDDKPSTARLIAENTAYVRKTGYDLPSTINELRRRAAAGDTEAAAALSQSNGKSLKDLRKKYRKTAKGLVRRLRKSSPGTGVVYVSGKDLEAAKRLAEAKGLKFVRDGSNGTAERIKLMGDDGAIDEIAKAYGRPIRFAGVKSMDHNPWIRVIGFLPSTNDPFVLGRDGNVYLLPGGRWERRSNQGSEADFQAMIDSNRIRFKPKSLGENIKRTVSLDEAQEWWEGAGYENRQNEAGRNAGVRGSGGINATWEEWDKITAQQRESIRKWIESHGKSIKSIGKNMRTKNGSELPDKDASPDETGREDPYGAQVLRRLHEDHSLLMKDYDSMMGPLENETVKSRLQKKLEDMESELTEYEEMFSKTYADLEGLVGEKEMDEGTEETGDLIEETADEGRDNVPDNSKEEFEEEVEPTEKDMDTMDDAAVPVAGMEHEEVDEDEVVEGMQVGMEGKSLSRVRAKYSKNGRKSVKASKIRRKDADEDDKEEKKEDKRLRGRKDLCSCGDPNCDGSCRNGRKRLKSIPRDPSELGDNATQADLKKFLRWAEQLARKEGVSVDQACDMLWGDGDWLGNARKYGLKMAPAIAAQVIPAVVGAVQGNGLKMHEKSMVKEASGFLGKLAEPTSQLDEEGRMKSYHYHKSFEGIGQLWQEAHDDLEQTPTEQDVPAADFEPGPYDSGAKDMTGEEMKEPEHQNGEVPTEEPEHMKTIRGASGFFKELAFAHDFGDPHRQKAAYWKSAIDPLYAEEQMEETVEEKQDEPGVVMEGEETLVEEEEKPEDEVMGEMGEKVVEERDGISAKWYEENESFSKGLEEMKVRIAKLNF